MSRESKSSQIRKFLISREGAAMTAPEVAAKFGTTPGVVNNLRSEIRRRGIPRPRREPHRSETLTSETASALPGESPATSDSPEHVAALTATGLEFVRVRLTTPSAVSETPTQDAEGWQHDCGATGQGKAPAACPKCGGA